jgi:hypothetical protein
LENLLSIVKEDEALVYKWPSREDDFNLVSILAEIMQDLEDQLFFHQIPNVSTY